MGVDGGALEAEVVVVLDDLFVDGGVVDGDGDEGDLGALALLEVKRRRLMSSRVAAGILSLSAEMNWMRASSRERAASPSLVMMTRTGMKPCCDVGEAEEVQSLVSSQGSAAMVTCSLGWASLAGYSAAGLAGGAFFVGGVGWQG